MKRKQMLIATFADGHVITRKTDREYSHAWRTISGAGGTLASGFSGSELLANNNAALYKARDDVKFEVVRVGVAPEGYEDQFKGAKPWRVKRTYADGRSYFESGNGNRHRRFGTQKEAQDFADKLTGTGSEGVTYVPVKE